MTTNHPAHGPVSLDRLHQIREILSKAAEQSDGGNLGYAMADAVKVIDGAIARELVRRDHAAWSQATFGDVGPVGPLKHLSKEALEAAAEPGDLSEWADMQFLLWDAQRRAGISDEQITQAMVEKLAVNKQREWPEPKDGEPRLHIKEQPAPVVPEYPETLPCPVLLEPGMRFGKGVKTRLVLEAIQRRAEHYAELEAMTPEQRAEHDAGIAEFKAMLGNGSRAAMLQAGNSPVTPDGWISCSERIPNDKQYVWCWGKSYGWTEYDTFEGYYDWSRNKWWTVTDDGEEPASKVTHWMPLPEPPREVK